MSKNYNPLFPGGVLNAQATFENADGTTIKDLVTAPSEGCRIDMLFASSDDTSDVDVLLYLNDGSNDIPIGRVTVPDGSGTNGTDKAVNLFTDAELPFLALNEGNPALFLKSGWKLRAGMQAAVTAAKSIYLVAIGGEYAA